VLGGAERFDSVANALAKLKPEAELVAIHDAVRPCLTNELIDAVFAAERVKVVRLPFRAPRANAYAERWVGTVRREVLDHLLIFEPRQLERVLKEFIDHYHTSRPHQGLGPKTPIRGARVPSESDDSQIIRIDRLGGLLHEYALAA